MPMNFPDLQSLELFEETNSIEAISDWAMDLMIHWRNKLTNFLLTYLRRNIDSELFKHRIGLNLSEFRSYLKSKFRLNMTWSNHGSSRTTWQIDHIIPCQRFDL